MAVVEGRILETVACSMCLPLTHPVHTSCKTNRVRAGAVCSETSHTQELNSFTTSIPLTDSLLDSPLSNTQCSSQLQVKKFRNRCKTLKLQTKGNLNSTRQLTCIKQLLNLEFHIVILKTRLNLLICIFISRLQSGQPAALLTKGAAWDLESSNTLKCPLPI